MASGPAPASRAPGYYLQPRIESRGPRIRTPAPPLLKSWPRGRGSHIPKGLCWDPLPESPPVPISGLCPLLPPPPNPSALATTFDQSETLSRRMSQAKGSELEKPGADAKPRGSPHPKHPGLFPGPAPALALLPTRACEWQLPTVSPNSRWHCVQVPHTPFHGSHTPQGIAFTPLSLTGHPGWHCRPAH